MEYEEQGIYTKQISAQKLWFSVLNTQIETGTPYLLYKDACNMKSNQKNLGTIKSSNLCTEIVEYSSPTETAVCNLASISLPNCVIQDMGKLCEEYYGDDIHTYYLKYKKKDDLADCLLQCIDFIKKQNLITEEFYIFNNEIS